MIYLLPLLGLLTLQNIIALTAPNWLWTLAAVSYVVGIALGMASQRSWIVERETRFAKVTGEWASMCAMMFVFAAGFVNGFLNATMPDLTQTAVFLVGYVGINCLASGHFLGRAITTLRAPVGQS